MIPGMQKPDDMLLPQLREDIRLLPSRPAANGAPTWVVFDPLADAYFQLDIESFQLLSAWPSCKTIGDMIKAIGQRYSRTIVPQDVMGLVHFLQTSRLTVDPTGGWRGLADVAAKHRSNPFSWLLHNYLFLKIPLVRPQVFLQRTLPVARFLASGPMLMIFAAITLMGLFMAGRRWSDFIGTFNDFWSPAGAATFGAALLVLKLFHEMGHAYVAAAKGCRVSSMGVAFMLGAPLAYTDVTDAWKLTNRRDRMAIDIAGVSVEMVIAGLATFAWVFLPDGNARAIAFIFATTGWVMSLAVNLNPFMRFDGYFILSDMLNIPNLQPRSFALGKWRLRRTLFGVDEAAPDNLEGRLRDFVITYGYAVWLYRLVMFTGIALAVYYMFFKALGILLFAIEIGVFILLPIWRELKVWWKERRSYAVTGRFALTMSFVAALVAVMAVPWSGTVSAPAVLETSGFARVFPKTPGDIRVVHVKVGAAVKEGDVLAELDSPKLHAEMLKVTTRLDLVRERLARRVADRKDLNVTPQLVQEEEALEARRAALGREIADLTIRAPIAGVMRELNPQLQPGRSIARQEDIGLITAGERLAVRGYITADDLVRLKAGNAGAFIPEDPRRSAFDVRLSEIGAVGVQTIDIAALASPYGGKVETWPQSKTGELTPVNASHLVMLDVTGSIPDRNVPEQVLRGTVRVDARPESLLSRVTRHVLRVLVRESGA
jgi:putative peptide zinc metalloprotease protein